MLPPLLRSASQTALLGPVLPTHNHWTGEVKPRSSLKKALRKKLVALLSRHFAKRKGRYLLLVLSFALASARLLVRSSPSPHPLRASLSLLSVQLGRLPGAELATRAARHFGPPKSHADALREAAAHAAANWEQAPPVFPPPPPPPPIYPPPTFGGEHFGA